MASLVGQTIGSYDVLDLLGHGGMGEVYRARHRLLTSREAAIKVLLAPLAATTSFHTRFQHEANNVARLNHPHILPLWEYGEVAGLPYFAMPLIEGGTLTDRLRAGPLPWPTVLGYLRQLADALDYAHSCGIVHRDLKPANVLIERSTTGERLYLADFGIAKVLQSDTPQLTQTGVGLGSPEYIAPEQAQGQAGPASDLYSLGVIAYQALTGRVPFTGTTPLDVIMKHVTAPLPPLRATNPALPPNVDYVVGRALAKSPLDRFPSASAFVGELERALLARESSEAPTTTITTAATVAPAAPAASTAYLPSLGVPPQTLAQARNASLVPTALALAFAIVMALVAFAQAPVDAWNTVLGAALDDAFAVPQAAGLGLLVLCALGAQWLASALTTAGGPIWTASGRRAIMRSGGFLLVFACTVFAVLNLVGAAGRGQLDKYFQEALDGNLPAWHFPAELILFALFLASASAVLPRAASAGQRPRWLSVALVVSGIVVTVAVSALAATIFLPGWYAPYEWEGVVPTGAGWLLLKTGLVFALALLLWRVLRARSDALLGRLGWRVALPLAAFLAVVAWVSALSA
ncbi:MAG: protein kinase domain-containing protein [Thermomicrobiales bacterium]